MRFYPRFTPVSGQTAPRLKSLFNDPTRIGDIRIWEDGSNNAVMVKHDSDPTSITDGNSLMEG